MVIEKTKLHFKKVAVEESELMSLKVACCRELFIEAIHLPTGSFTHWGRVAHFG
jgi:hypothetical protein